MFPTRRARGRRGVAILAFTLVLTVIAAVSAVYLAQTLMDHKRINERRRELWRAFLHAEAGIAQVQHWALHPDDYTPNTTLWENQTGTSFAAKYPSLASQISSGGLIVSESMLDGMGISGFTTETGWFLGRIAQISVLPLDGSEPVSAAGAVFKIVSLGEAVSGVQREVIGYATLEQVTSIQLPAPLISMSTANGAGNPKIHWGEAWARSTFHFALNPNNLSYALSDDFVVFRTEHVMTFANSWKWGLTSHNNHLYSNFLSQSANPVGRRPGLFDDGTGDWKDKFYSHVPQGVLDWPDLASQYSLFKDLALQNGRYYTTNSSNELLKDGVVVDFDTEFGGQQLDLVFVDTTNQQPPVYDPADPGYNLATLSEQGNSAGLAGFFYVNANFTHQGQGNPPSVTGLDPNTDSDFVITSVWLDGVMYTAGTMDISANSTVHGSLVTEGGFVGQGTPDIYYNTDLADGLDLGGGNLGSPFNIQLHNNQAP